MSNAAARLRGVVVLTSLADYLGKGASLDQDEGRLLFEERIHTHGEVQEFIPSVGYGPKAERRVMVDDRKARSRH